MLERVRKSWVGAGGIELGPRDRLIGQLLVQGNLRVSGMVECELVVTGDVEIDGMAAVTAALSGRDVNIVKGAVTARRMLVIGEAGSLIGDAQVSRLIVREGNADWQGLQ